jgi:hypothetical protein
MKNIKQVANQETHIEKAVGAERARGNKGDPKNDSAPSETKVSKENQFKVS